jgi:chromosome partitioning protein
VRSASPPTATAARAGTAEGSPAGERSGRGAGPGPAQDGETSTVDQSREWPYRDTAPRQDPAEARVDPIWGADPPDSARWHMDTTADQATPGSKSPDRPTDPQNPARTESEPGRDQDPPPGPPAAGVGAVPAIAPDDGLPSEHQEHAQGLSPERDDQVIGSGDEQAGSLVGPPGEPAGEEPSSQGAGAPVGWFSADSASFTGSLTEQLSAYRPDDAPSQGQRTEAAASAQDAPAGAEPGLGGSGTVGPAESWGPVGSGGPAPSEGAADASTARHGADPQPGQQGTHSPELIEAGMVYVDPDPEIGASPAAVERLEGSNRASSGTERVPGGDEDTATVVPGTIASEPGQASSVSGPTPDVTGEPELATAAAEEPSAVTEAGVSLDATSTEPAAGPWTEPALPGLPAGVPSSRGQGAAWHDEGSPDDVLAPRPDPAWPRLFGQRAGNQESGGTDEALSPEDQAAASLRDADPAAHGERPSEQGDAQAGGATPAPAHGAAGSPPREDLVSDTRPSADVGATLGNEPADGSAADRLPDATVSERGGPSDWADEHPVEPTGEEDAATPINSSSQAGDHVAVVDITTSDPEPDRDRDVLGGPPGEAAAAARPTTGTPAVRGGADGTEQANMATVARTADAGEVNLREASPSPSGDVSRETSAGGGEEMESREEEQAVVEDEAAVAVRDAVTRAAAEAGVDVSRETEVPEEELPADGLVGEPSVDSEAAARNARVTFRIHRETLNGTRRVTAVANQKGGVGKSTTTVNIGAYLALAGARVLVVDLDPQGNASTGLGLDHREIEPSIYDVLAGEAPTTAAIRATSVANLHVLPSTIDLAGAEVELVSAMSRETRLRRALESIDHQYDTVLIDCPPSLGLLTVNALAAANELLIPIQCEYYALEGLGQLLRNVELVRANLNPELRIGGIVLTMYDGRTRLALQVVEEVRKHFTDIVYQTVVPRSVRLSEAPGYGVPIALYDPLSRGGIAYRDLTFELAERTGLLAPTGEGAS